MHVAPGDGVTSGPADEKCFGCREIRTYPRAADGELVIPTAAPDRVRAAAAVYRVACRKVGIACDAIRVGAARDFFTKRA
jgi:hypothetical protein